MLTFYNDHCRWKEKTYYKINQKNYEALKKVEEGSSKSPFATKYDIPKNTLSTWIRNKEKIFESMKV